MGQARDLRVLLGDALVGVDEDEADIRALDGRDGAQIGIALDRVVDL